MRRWPALSAGCAECDRIRRENAGRPVRYCSNACRQRAYRQRTKTPGADGSAAVGMIALTSFVGRAIELGEVERLLRSNRLVTVVGPFGVGKTRLAAEVAGRACRAGRAEVAVVELASATGPDGLARAMAATWGLLEPPGVSVVEALVAKLSGRQVQLVLDNCEHLLGECASLLSELLPRLAGLTVLATSREPLRLPGEVVFSLAGLPSPAVIGGLSFADSLGFDAVRLFVDRARAVRPELGFTDADAESIVTVCVRLDGVPLAIELAARLMRTYRLVEIRDRLDDRLKLFTGGWRTSDRRHHSLRGAIRWSYDLLSPDEQALFRRLSFLPGRFDAEAAELVADSVSGRSSALETLSSLEAKSLIRARPDIGGFDMLESIRCFGRERLAEHGEEDQAAERLLGWLVKLVSPLMDNVSAPVGLLTRLQQHHENLAHVFRWLGDGEDERRLLVAVAMVVSRLSLGYSGLRGQQLIDAIGRVTPSSRYRSLAIGSAAWLALCEGDNDLAPQLIRVAVETERAGECRPAVLGRLLLQQSHIARRSGDADTTVIALRDAADCCREIGDRLGLALCANDLAWELLDRADVDRAKALSDMARAYIETTEVAPADLRSAVFHTAGVIALELGDLSGAEARFSTALRAAVTGLEHADAIEGIAIVALRTGRFERGLLLAGAVTVFTDRTSWRDTWCAKRLTRALELARDALPERRRTALVAEGARLDPRKAVDHALESQSSHPAEEPQVTALNTREWAVVDLVARGLNNHQIAGKLHLSVSTVEKHVRKIRGTFGLRSRAQIAAWAVRHRRFADHT
ncbi:LuxR C-terminal-related transcriptional regulator [Lentzea sp. NBRC 105346]|uniref:ATP-binding protein n=1 Tax=Lentzea sp. NBRC 105346 TaxID=3032205 RepID=UPI002552AD6F|nr:LuxR C-terminal-related transcriptional regulator [Lentzea sp. NBRC 105346]